MTKGFRVPEIHEFKEGFKFQHYMNGKWRDDFVADLSQGMIVYFRDCLDRGVIRVKE